MLIWEPLAKLCRRVGLSQYQGRILIGAGRLDAIKIGTRICPARRLDRFIAKEQEVVCLVEIPGQNLY